MVSGAVTVSVARALAEMCATICSGTRAVLIGKATLFAPAGTVTVSEAGPGAMNGWSDRIQTGVSAGMIPFRVTVQMVVLPPNTGLGAHVTAFTVGYTDCSGAAFMTPL